MENEFEDRFADKDIKNSLNAWRESVDSEAERPEWFWARQRARIASGMKPPKPQRLPQAAWAGIAATVALGVALMFVNKPVSDVTGPGGPVPPTAHPQMTDQQLMSELENTMNSGVPEALQPASTLAQEMEQAHSARTTSKVKERMQ